MRAPRKTPAAKKLRSDDAANDADTNAQPSTAPGNEATATRESEAATESKPDDSSPTIASTVATHSASGVEISTKTNDEDNAEGDVRAVEMAPNAAKKGGMKLVTKAVHGTGATALKKAKGMTHVSPLISAFVRITVADAIQAGEGGFKRY